MFARKIIQGVFFEQKIGLNEDKIFNFNILDKAPRFVELKVNLYGYTYREDSLSRKKRGFVGYYFASKFCSEFACTCSSRIKPLIVKEGLKNAFFIGMNLEMKKMLIIKKKTEV